MLRRSQVLMTLPGAPLGALEGQFANDNPDRHASLTVVTVGAIGKCAAATKTCLNQSAIDNRIDQVTRCRDLRPGQLLRQVAARIRRGSVEL